MFGVGTKTRYILRVTDEDNGVMYFHDLDAFQRDCKQRGIDASSDYPLLMERLKAGEEFADATTEYKWVEVRG